MLKKIFTNRQLSYLFQIAIILDTLTLLAFMIIYRYFPNFTLLKLLNENLDNLSIFMVCLIIISQSIRIFMHRYKKLISNYPLIALTTLLSICIFLAWVLIIDDTIGDEFVIFSSSVSRFDHSILVISVLIAICSSLLFDLYKTISNPDNIDKMTVPSMIQSVIRLLLIKYFFIFIAYFQLIKVNSFHQYSIEMVHETISSLMFNAHILGILIACAWVITISYYAYTKYYHKK